MALEDQPPSPNETEMRQALTKFNADWKKRVGKGIRPMGARGHPRPAPLTPHAAAPPSQVSGYQEFSAQSANSSPTGVQLQKSAIIVSTGVHATLVYTDVTHEPDGPGAARQAGKAAWKISWKIAKLLALFLALAAFLGLIIASSFGGDDVLLGLPAPAQNLPSIRLNSTIDIPGLHCVAARLTPLATAAGQLPESLERVPEVTSKLGALARAEQEVVAQLVEVDAEIASLEQWHREIVAAQDNSMISAVARVFALRDLDSLNSRIKALRARTTQLQNKIYVQTDRFIPDLTTTVQQLCADSGEHALGNIYADIWGDSGHNGTADEAHYTLLLRGFCASVGSAGDSSPDAREANSPVPAATLLLTLESKVDTLSVNASTALTETLSECTAVCRIASTLTYLVDWARP